MTWTTRPRSDLGNGISAIREGRGSPLVLIHGVGLNADSWGAQIDVLRDNWSVIAIDLPGHGSSAALTNLPNVRAFSDAIATAIRALNTPVRLAGHSLGALIALDMTARHADLVIAAAMLNVIHRRTAEAQDAVRARAQSMPINAPGDPTPTLTRWFGPNLSSEAAKACRRWLTDVDPAAYKAAYTAFANADSPDDTALSAITCPMLFLTGGDEPNSTPDMSHSLAATVADGRAVIVEGAAHMAMMTHPQTVNATLVDFYGAT